MLNKQPESEVTVQAKAPSKGAQIVVLERSGEMPPVPDSADKAVRAGAAALPEGHNITATLAGLGCMACTGKMETEIRKLPGVESVSVDFVAQKLILQTYLKSDLSNLSQKVTDIIQGIEPGVQVKYAENSPGAITASAAGTAESVIKADQANTEDLDDHGHEHGDKLPLIQLVLGGVFICLGAGFKTFRLAGILPFI